MSHYTLYVPATDGNAVECIRAMLRMTAETVEYSDLPHLIVVSYSTWFSVDTIEQVRRTREAFAMWRALYPDMKYTLVCNKTGALIPPELIT